MSSNVNDPLIQGFFLTHPDKKRTENNRSSLVLGKFSTFLRLFLNIMLFLNLSGGTFSRQECKIVPCSTTAP